MELNPAFLLHLQAICCQYGSVWKKVNLTNQSWSPCPFRSTPSTSSSVRAGGTKGWSSTDPCRFCPWTTCWPVRSGLLTPSSTTGRSLWPTTWRHLTNCCAWLTTARSSTRWGKTHWGLDPVVVQFQLPCCRCGLNTITAESGRRWWFFEHWNWPLTEVTTPNHLCVKIWRLTLSAQLWFIVTANAEKKKNTTNARLAITVLTVFAKK